MSIDPARLARIKARILVASAIAATGCGGGGQQTVNELPPHTINERPREPMNEPPTGDTPPSDPSADPSATSPQTPQPEQAPKYK